MRGVPLTHPNMGGPHTDQHHRASSQRHTLQVNLDWFESPFIRSSFRNNRIYHQSGSSQLKIMLLVERPASRASLLPRERLGIKKLKGESTASSTRRGSECTGGVKRKWAQWVWRSAQAGSLCPVTCLLKLDPEPDAEKSSKFDLECFSDELLPPQLLSPTPLLVQT